MQHVHRVPRWQITRYRLMRRGAIAVLALWAVLMVCAAFLAMTARATNTNIGERCALCSPNENGLPGLRPAGRYSNAGTD